MQTKQRLRLLWEQVKERKLGDMIDEVREYLQNVKDVADPIEALHGHLCGPGCLHWDFLTEEQRDKLRSAPWNKPKA